MRYVVVNGRGLGSPGQQENYAEQAKGVVAWLGRNGRVKPTDKVVLATNIDDALREFANGEHGALIFLTAKLGSRAKEIAQRYQKRIRVFCYTGRIPDGEVIYFDKFWGNEGIKSFVEAIVSSPP